MFVFSLLLQQGTCQESPFNSPRAVSLMGQEQSRVPWKCGCACRYIGLTTWGSIGKVNHPWVTQVRDSKESWETKVAPCGKMDVEPHQMGRSVQSYVHENLALPHKLIPRRGRALGFWVGDPSGVIIWPEFLGLADNLREGWLCAWKNWARGLPNKLPNTGGRLASPGSEDVSMLSLTEL